MPKQKPSAQIRIADGAGGMRPLADLRFQDKDWPIEFVVAAEDAVAWIAHLIAEADDRSWSWSSLSQIDAAENSGTLSVYAAGGPNPPTLDIVWDKPRAASLRLRARPGGSPTLSIDVAREFIDAVIERVRQRISARAHRWDLLSYEGLPWRGQLWLEDDLCLGPPSRFPGALLGPQVVIVDAMIEGIGHQGITANFQARLLELRIFLGAVLGIYSTPVRPRLGWVAQFDEQHRPIMCDLRPVGYWEVGPPRTFPARGVGSPIHREVADRPGLGRTGIWPDMRECWVPTDIEELWGKFMRLPTEKREQFLRAGNAHLIARSMWPDQRTAYAAFMVVACEALKPSGRRYDTMNIYDVVASLLDLSAAEQLRKHSHRPQQVRSKHFHRGELAAGELLPILVEDTFADPSFDEMLSALSTTCRTCLIEWLRRDGEYTPARVPRSPSGRAGYRGTRDSRARDLTSRSTRTRRKRRAG